MNNTYENINTFSDDIYKSDLREKILNPMIVQHNSMGLDLFNNAARIKALEEGGTGVTKFKDLDDVPTFVANRYLRVNTGGDLEWSPVSSSGTGVDEARIVSIEEDVAEHSVKIAALEAGSGGGSSYDDTAITARIKAVEDDLTITAGEVTSLTSDVEDHDNRIASLELGGGGGSGVDLTPLLTRLDDLEAEDIVLASADAASKVVTDDHEGRIATLETASGGPGGSYDDTALTARVVAVENETTNLQTELGTANGNINTLQASDVDHESRIATLEASPGGGVTAAGVMALLEEGTGIDLALNGTSTKVVVTSTSVANEIDAKDVKYTWSADHLPANSVNKVVSKAEVKNRSFFISASADPAATVDFELPSIADWGTTLSSTSIYGGRFFYFANTGASQFTVKAGTLKIVSGTGTVDSDFIIPAGHSAILVSVCRDTNTYKNYHVIMAARASF